MPMILSAVFSTFNIGAFDFVIRLPKQNYTISYHFKKKKKEHNILTVEKMQTKVDLGTNPLHLYVPGHLYQSVLPCMT